MTHASHEVADSVACWCCGEQQGESTVVRLGNHPEVALCLRCAHFVHRRARAHEDVGMHTLATRGRDLLRSAESFVVEHDWQHKPVVGPLLRWLGLRLP
jgi:hypothetical protein